MKQFKGMSSVKKAPYEVRLLYYHSEKREIMATERDPQKIDERVREAAERWGI